MVTRYDLHICGYPETSETEGDWVKYEDYEKLNCLVQELAATVDMSKLSHRDKEQLREWGYL